MRSVMMKWLVVMTPAVLCGALPSCKGKAADCAAAADCAGRSFPVDCEGRWECRSGSCEPVCDFIRCGAAADCTVLPLSGRCRSHWECLSGDCLPVCDAWPCEGAADCEGIAWTQACPGSWECEGGECEARCGGTPCVSEAECASLPWTKTCPGAWTCLGGRCAEQCDGESCDDWSDCMRLPWPRLCDGAWECTDGTCDAVCDVTGCEEEIPFHEPVLDAGGKLLPWDSPDRVIRLAMGFVEACPRDPVTGLPWYMQYSEFRYQTMQPAPWPHNPAGLYAMMVETLVRYFPYTGERKWIEFVRRPLDQLIAWSTPGDCAWPRVPYASADNSGRFTGGSAEGIDGIQPDKVAQAAVGYLRFYQVTGEREYLYEAIHCANVLASKIREGDDLHSPWPFRVNARTGEVIEEYTSEVLWPIVLFDEVARMGLSLPGHAEARAAAWNWLVSYPMEDRVWKGYFEDVIIDEGNVNRDQYTPGEVARYLVRHPGLDPEWQGHVQSILSWVKEELGDTDPKWCGATGIREQYMCMQLAGSHTARYGSVLALWSAAGGGEPSGEEALRTLALATYLAKEDGIVAFSICDQDVWFTDGYFDYVPHFIDAMAAMPELAPAGEDHLLYSSSVVTDISYAPGRIEYGTFHDRGEETLRLGFVPSSVEADGRRMEERTDGEGPGFSFDPVLSVLRVHREGSSHVLVRGFDL
jgi:hypothetical protein